jgi:hypothetical protein
MNKFICFLAGSLLLFSCNKNETPKPDNSGQFVKFFGGAFDDQGFSVASAPDGGFYLAGSTTDITRPDTNILVVKINQQGNKVWERRYNLGTVYDEAARDILVSVEGNIIVAGYKKNKYGFADFLVLEINKDNPDDIEEHIFGDSLVDEQAYNIVPASENTYVVFGTTIPDPASSSADMYLLRTHLNDTIWNRKIGVANKNEGPGTLKINDQGQILWSGTVQRGADQTDMRLVLSDGYGNLLWDYGFNELDDLNQNGYSMDLLTDGYLIAGSTDRVGSSIKDIFLVRTNKIGTDAGVSKHQIVLSGSSSQEAYSILANDDNEYVLTGYTTTDKGTRDIYVAKVNSNGSIVSSNTFGGVENDEGRKILKTNDGYLVIGSIMAGNNNMMGVYRMNEKLELVK